MTEFIEKGKEVNDEENKLQNDTTSNLNDVKQEVLQQNDTTSNLNKPKKHRRYRKKYKDALEKIWVSLTKKDRKNFIKNHDKKEIKHFYKEMNKAIEKNKLDKFLKKRKGKGYDDLLTKISEKDNKNSHKNNSRSTTDNSTEKSTETSGKTDNTTETSWETSSTTAEVWEAANVPKTKEARMKRLFPEGTPKSKEEMKKYLTKIEVPIHTADWETETKTLTVTVHEKLADEYKAIFKEMYDKNIPVNPKKTWAFAWRDVRGRPGIPSHHCWWWALDLNWNVNGWAFWKTDKNSPYYNDKETVEIRERHGFARWWDRSTKRNDPMHFTYTLW